MDGLKRAMLAKRGIISLGTLRFRGSGWVLKKVLDHLDDEMLTLVLELGDIELFKYYKKKSHN